MRTVKSNMYSLEGILICILIVLISFVNSGPFITKGVLYITFFWVIFMVPITNKIALYHKKIAKASLVLILYNTFILLIYYENYTSLYNALLYNACILFFLILVSSNYKLQQLKSFIRYMSAISKILIIFGLVMIIIGNPFLWVSRPSFLFLFLYFIYLDSETKLPSKTIFTLIWLLVIILEEARTFLLLFPILLLLNLLWKKIIKSRKLYMILFIIISLLLFMIPIGYVMLSKSTYSAVLNEYALKYTQSRFFSGRDIIWSNLINYYLEKNLFLGGGHHLSPSFVFGISLSSHNTYVTILTRTGIIGSLLFLNFIKSIWNAYYKYKDVPAVKLSGVFLIVSLLKQSSELSLISNNIALSLVNWVVIAFGLIYVNAINSTSRKQERENINE